MQNYKIKDVSPVTWVEVDLGALRHNVTQIQELAAGNPFFLPFRPDTANKTFDATQVLAVIKADAYGHGMDKVGPELDRMGVGFFGVSDVPEGIRLRNLGIKKPVLLFESTLPDYAKQMAEYDLMPAVCTMDLAEALNECGQKKKKRVDIHVVLDTGMGRLGVWYKEAYPFIEKLMNMRYLRVMGIMTHFPAADSDRAFTKQQIRIVYNLVKRLDQGGLIIPYIHAANSMGLASYETHVLNLARPGLMLYGLYPHPSLQKKISLRPVMSVKSKVLFLKDVGKGRSISYGRTFFTQKDMKVAVVPIGYHDGYFRSLSNQSHMVINGVRCPVIGRVTMDQCMLDVSKVPYLMAGMPVTVIGQEAQASVTADELADIAGTINYEIVCNLGNRLPRIYK
ncbi:MAG: alanine racemase [Candidatus Omnitrophica bacterium]|nr:alanine racemase [Candidatus Omnitrophota bacterium]